jgi:hypothetical protein
MPLDALLALLVAMQLLHINRHFARVFDGQADCTQSIEASTFKAENCSLR